MKYTLWKAYWVHKSPSFYLRKTKSCLSPILGLSTNSKWRKKGMNDPLEEQIAFTLWVLKYANDHPLRSYRLPPPPLSFSQILGNLKPINGRASPFIIQHLGLMRYGLMVIYPYFLVKWHGLENEADAPCHSCLQMSSVSQCLPTFLSTQHARTHKHTNERPKSWSMH